METRKVNGTGCIFGKWPLAGARATIIFIHGAGGTGNYWKSQTAELAARANTVAIDLPGHGQSDGSGHDNIAEYAGAVADFINAIDASYPVICGFSLGGAVAQQVMLDFPDLVEAGILACSGATMRVGKALFESIENDYDGFVDFICKLAASKNSAPEIVRSFRNDFLNLNAATTYSDFQACHQFDVTDRLSSIAKPVLVLTAEEDKLTPPHYGDFLVKEIADATRVHIKNAGHIVALEQPGEVNDAIRKFLDQIGL